MNHVINKHVVWHNHEVNRKHRECLHKHHAILLWFTGLSGSGKSTIAGALEKRLHLCCISTYLLDGDNIRHGLCNDLGFDDSDRYENLRRVGEVASIMVDAGLVVLAAFISPYRSERHMIRNMLPSGLFFEIFVDTPLSVCESRDSKGLYRSSRIGEITNFIGIHTLYERPQKPDIYLDGEKPLQDLVNQAFKIIITRIMMC